MAENIPTIQWVEKVVALQELRPYEKNPRKITKEQFERLKASILADGYHSRIKATRDLRVIGGHQRLKALGAAGIRDVAVLVPDREISDEQFQRILLTDNHNNGVFDMDMLANGFELDFLQGIGLHEVTSIAPMDDGAPPPPGKVVVKCPKCGECFPTKGNKVDT